MRMPWENHVIPEKTKPETRRRLDSLRKDGERTERPDMRTDCSVHRRLCNVNAVGKSRNSGKD
jgi:hypothetical protein